MADSSKYLRDASGSSSGSAPHPNAGDAASFEGFDSDFAGPTGPDRHITSAHEASSSDPMPGGGGGYAAGGSKHIL